MRIYVDRDSCLRSQAVCDLCFGRMVRRQQWPDRPCIVHAEDDGREAATFVLPTSRGFVQIELDANMREQLAWGGIDAFVA